MPCWRPLEHTSPVPCSSAVPWFRYPPRLPFTPLFDEAPSGARILAGLGLCTGSGGCPLL